jgi:glutamate-1-semialdehyde 2,1-aminomutase
MDLSAEDYSALQEKFVNAARKMKADGWWLTAGEYPEREKIMRSRLIKEMLGSLIQMPPPVANFYSEVMRRKVDDHHASHSNGINQLFHLLSSSVFIYCYLVAFFDLTSAMCLGLAALFVRQFGHAILEPSCHDKEALLLGYNTRNKTLIVLGYILIPILQFLQTAPMSEDWSYALATIALHWFLWTLAVVLGRIVYLAWKHDLRISMIWFVKLVTDPFTDIVAYFPRWPQRA